MSHQSPEDLVDRWKGAEAPLLPLLHAFQERDGYISEPALRAVSQGLNIPLADLFATVSFYHHLTMEPGGWDAPRVCDGPVCKQKGSAALLDALPGARPMACSGRCDDPIPVLRRGRLTVGLAPDALEARPSPLPPPPPDGVEECVFAKIREPGRATLKGYRATGGFRGLTWALEAQADAVLQTVEQSGLRGRGGAGFPTAAKWRAVKEAHGEPKVVVCNADEGEPGCFKDRALLDHDPWAVIEGMLCAALATGASMGFIYLRYEYPETFTRLEAILEEAHREGLLGEDALGPGRSFRLYLRRGAGAYICGEETSLLNSLEGKHPFPRNRPPYPVTHGYRDKPTAVNNVETLASVPPILQEGADWYRGLGLGDHAGTKVISLSGDIRRPGNYEVPLGLPLSTLLNEWAGGPSEGRRFQAVTMAGLSGGFLDAKDIAQVTLDDPSIRARGSFLGAGGIIVYDDSRSMRDAARDAMAFFADESCGKCFPCRIGTQRLLERIEGVAGPDMGPDWVDEVRSIGEVMQQASACGLGQAAPLVTESLIRRFSPDLGLKNEGADPS